MLTKDEIAAQFKALQDDICARIEASDGLGKFHEDLWDRPAGGGGRTRIMSSGAVIEKGGVNFSAVHGPLPEMLQNQLGLHEGEFFATGVSIVMHPKSPKVPIIHMNVRYFEAGETCWFGGGIDLTPHYVVEEDARNFHQILNDICDQHDSGYYEKFKQWADDYFFIPHRNETRGIGGIFFDHLSPDHEKSIEDLFAFVMDVGMAFAPVYTHLMDAHKSESYTEAEKNWQLVRRGRYVEFNLVYDRGTKFGLETDGRIESILMSLPEHASWIYNHQVAEGSEEAATLSRLRKGIKWLG